MADQEALAQCLPGIYRAVGEVPFFGPLHVPGGMLVIQMAEATIVVDPFVLSDLSALEVLGRPTHVVISGVNHVRDAAFYRKHYGAQVLAHRDLMSKVAMGIDTFFQAGDVLPGDLQVIDMPGTFRGEVLLLQQRDDGGVLMAGDAFFNLQQEDFKVPGMRLVGFREGLNTMPRFFIRKGGREAYHRVLDCDFDVLLVSHGAPILEGARKQVQTLVESL